MMDLYCLGHIKQKDIPNIETLNQYLDFTTKPGFVTVVYKLKRTAKGHLIWSWHRWIRFSERSTMLETLNIYLPMWVNTKTARADDTHYSYKKYREEDLMPTQDYLTKYYPELV